MARARGKNMIALNGATLCDIVQDWLNAGGPFAKSPVKVTEVKSEAYDDRFSFSFEQNEPAPAEAEKESTDG